jgi:hypothetical protein
MGRYLNVNGDEVCSKKLGILSLVLLFLVFRYIIPGYLKEATNKKKK